MRLALAAALGLLSTGALAADPPADTWKAKGREIFQHAIEIPTVEGRGQVPALAQWLADQYKAAGWAEADIHVISYEGNPGNQTAGLVVRWPAARPSGKKPILLMAHMDVVEAKPADWSMDPFKFVEKDGYFYGRGTSDIKQGVTAVTTALLRLRASGFKPTRDIVVLFTGDEETSGKGAQLGATEWRKWTDAEFALNSDGGGGGVGKDGRWLGFALQTAEKTYSMYSFTVRNPGGHSSKPRPDNAIYQLAHALERLEKYRFTPQLNETTRAYFGVREKSEKGPLGDAMRRWLANPGDGAAADIIEADPGEVGLTRTRCVATRLEGGHADNALPQLARATINCRIMPGTEPAAVRDELERVAADPGVVVERTDNQAMSLASPLRPDVVAAYTAAVHRRHPQAPIMPEMSTGASDARPFRVAGIPVYGVDGSWGVIPDDMRAHGRDERLPVQALYDDIDHWVDLLTALAGK
ncbi:MAG: M20/M25/M40 family metallo-hydrolase [Alphaproteobacteria bacterium]|nr:M20/M25/M40 family metallo-hydrolase [Alphaproteobacteria bacterium]MBV9373261.1 M20/M25/M40 family metallo-hydrolase [Alphaproteobacteria bacterium]MBV9901227.1 M20/M25/M40 family metallo-hydrolase [Alphaproteobacteria bacterium]